MSQKPNKRSPEQRFKDRMARIGNPNAVRLENHTPESEDGALGAKNSISSTGFTGVYTISAINADGACASVTADGSELVEKLVEMLYDASRATHENREACRSALNEESHWTRSSDDSRLFASFELDGVEVSVNVVSEN